MSTAEQTLLIIDADEAFRDRVAAYLQGAGYAVTVAATTEEGMAIYAELTPDLVLCELDSRQLADPQPSGPTEADSSMLAAVREASPLKPVIVVSNEGNMGGVLNALRRGADDYLTKPIIDLKVLEHAIERCLEQSRLRQQNLDYRHRLELSNRELQESLELLRQDQKAGRQVQFRMLPETPKQFGDYVFSHRIVPSLYLSGDFVDYYRLGEHRVVFFIADVSGHGASSAFVTVLLKNLFARKRSEYIHSGQDLILSPRKMLQYANQELLNTDIGKHATLCVGVLDLRRNSLTYSVAGHLPLPLMASPQQCDYLPGEGMPIGLFEEAEYSESTVEIPENAVLTFFSDGILEVLDADGVLQKEQLLKDRLSSGPRDMDKIVSALDIGHVHEVPDDIAALLICRQTKE